MAGTNTERGGLVSVFVFSSPSHRSGNLCPGCAITFPRFKGNTTDPRQIGLLLEIGSHIVEAGLKFSM